MIPATLAVTFIALRVLGESFNLMTLGGLAAAVGLVIDDAIVVVENIVMHRDAGQSRAEAIRSAIDEIRVPLIGSTITPIVVFLPLISITGVTGTFFKALAVTVGMALLTSLALALTWTPTLSHYFIRQPERNGTPARNTDAGRRAGLPPSVMRATSACCGRRSSARCCSSPAASSSWWRRTAATGCSGRTCCRRWTKAASSSTTSCRPARRSRRPTA